MKPDWTNKEYRDEMNRRNKLYARKTRLKKVYGITLEYVEALHVKQGGKCAICGIDELLDKRLSVDHCHVTGRVRGLLCASCNFALGCMRDDIELLRKAIHYLSN